MRGILIGGELSQHQIDFALSSDDFRDPPWLQATLKSMWIINGGPDQVGWGIILGQDHEDRKCPGQSSIFGRER
jgi:hypothetical protein